MKIVLAALAVIFLSVATRVPIHAQATATQLESFAQNHHVISQSEAKELIDRYQKVNPFKAWAFHAGTLPKDMLEALLKQPKTAFLGYYFAVDDDGQPQVIYVARTLEGKDIITQNGIFTPLRLNSGKDVTNDNFLTEPQARRWIANFKKHEAYKTMSGYVGGSMLVTGVRSLLQAPTTSSIRTYFALSKTNQPHLVLIGTNTAGTLEQTAMILDRNVCPPICEPEFGCGELCKN